MQKPPSLRNNNGSLQVRVRIDGKDAFINRLGRWSDPVAVAKAHAIAAQIWSDYQQGCFDRSLMAYQPLINGKEAAMLAGLDHVNGRCAAAVLIDSDLQHPPELIEAMVCEWQAGAEVVTAVRDDQDQESRLKVASAHWFYRVFNKVVDSIELREGAGDFRLLDASVLDAVTQLRESSRFSKGLLPWTGYRSVDLPYQRVSRVGGQTSWSPLQLFSYAFDGIFSFSVLPLKVWTGIGVMVSSLSLLYALIVILRTVLFGVDVEGYASLMVAVLFLGGIQLIGIGVLGEYVGRIYVESKSRPHYFIRRIHNA